jgi:hypothetical protein
MRGVLLCLVIASAHEAHAGACGTLLDVTAKGPQLARDGLVLLDTLHVEAVVPLLDKATLVAADGTVYPTKLVKRAGSEYRLQALFAPQKELPAHAVVHLAFGVPELDKELAELTLTTSDATAAEVHWKKAPVALQRHREESNKGDGADAYRVRVALDADAFVVASVTYADKTTASEVFGADVYFGRMGCHSILSSRSGTVTFSAFGANGEVAAPGKPMKLRY